MEKKQAWGVFVTFAQLVNNGTTWVWMLDCWFQKVKQDK